VRIEMTEGFERVLGPEDLEAAHDSAPARRFWSPPRYHRR
jgi:hypothetical protein